VEIVKAATLLTAGAYYNTVSLLRQTVCLRRYVTVCETCMKVVWLSRSCPYRAVYCGIKLDGGSVLKYHGDFVEIS